GVLSKSSKGFSSETDITCSALEALRHLINPQYPLSYSTQARWRKVINDEDVGSLINTMHQSLEEVNKKFSGEPAKILQELFEDRVSGNQQSLPIRNRNSRSKVSVYMSKIRICLTPC